LARLPPLHLSTHNPNPPVLHEPCSQQLSMWGEAPKTELKPKGYPLRAL
jgi:hypothetical protein